MSTLVKAIQGVFLAVAGLFIFLLLLAMMPWGTVEAAGSLAIGWVEFIRRVAPNITFNGSGIALAVVCSGLIIAGIHWLASGFCRHSALASLGPWPWGRSVACYVSVWLLFLAAMGVTGLAHQLGWLIRAKEPLLVVKDTPFRDGHRLRQEAFSVFVAATDAEWDAADARKFYLANQPTGRLFAPDPWETFEVIFLSEASRKLRAAVVFHRDERRRERAGVALVTPDADVESRDVRDLPMLLVDPAKQARNGSRPKMNRAGSSSR